MTTPPSCLVENVGEALPIPAEAAETSAAPLPESADAPPPENDRSGPACDLWLYRDRTIAMLRRFLRLSIEVGRLPSLLGREFFRTRVTSYTVATFEDAVIFVHDIERIMDTLDDFDQKLIAKMVFQDYSQDEAANILKCGRRTLVRRFPDLLDEISKSFLEGGMLARLPVTKSKRPKSCQGGEEAPKPATD